MSKRLNDHLSTKQLDVIRTKLLTEVDRIQHKFKEQKVEYTQRQENSIHKDEVDSANDNILLSQEMRFSNRDLMYLKKLNKAISKASDEEFGMCQECGAAITFQRLMARPTSELCIVCKEESEREEGQNFYQRQSKSLGQEVNLVRSL